VPRFCRVRENQHDAGERIATDWARNKTLVQNQWDKLTDEYIDDVAGDRELLVDRIQAVYGVSRHEAELEISDRLNTDSDVFRHMEGG